MRVNAGDLGVCLLAAALLAACGGSGGSGASSSASSSAGSTAAGSGTDHVTFKHDVARTGLDPTETSLTLSNVNSTSFGLLRQLQVDGLVDAQPLYLSQLAVGGSAHNVVFAATEGDSVYAFDADSGATLWHVSLIPAGETTSDAVYGCSQVQPQIGITSTPVIDRSAGAHGTLFVVAMTRGWQRELPPAHPCPGRDDGRRAARRADRGHRDVRRALHHQQLRARAVRGACRAAPLAGDALHELDLALR